MNLIAATRLAQAERKRAVIATVTGRAMRTDTIARSQIGGFDGGARAPLPLPPITHDEWLGDVLRHRRADVGASF